jgi:allantoinase
MLPVHAVDVRLFLHIASADAVGRVAAAQEAGLPVTAETCPHYLSLAAEEVPDGAPAFKCAPPIRERDNRERLWAALARGALVGVVSDHSPCPPDMKVGDFLRAWGGIASLELGLRVVWTEARARGHGIEDVVRWMSAGPAALGGLRSKGAIQAGRDADLVLYDPEPRERVDPQALQQRHAITPYAGRELDGRVVATYLRGVEVYREGRIVGDPTGRLLARDERAA